MATTIADESTQSRHKGEKRDERDRASSDDVERSAKMKEIEERFLYDGFDSKGSIVFASNKTQRATIGCSWSL